jgi:beta-RFAP synthase
MGFIDLSGALGRQFGSIGVALNEIHTRLSITPSNQFNVFGHSVERAAKCVDFFRKSLDLTESFQLEIETAIPEHVGLGSGTQLSLAVGTALNAFFDLGLSVREIAALTDRGMRSGIGIGVFEQGGLVVDGGRGEKTITPPVISHLNIPEDWRFILVFDRRGKGLHGNQEVDAFKELPGFPQEEAARLCYLLMMQGLPAVAEQDISRFGEVISILQQSVGDHFAPVQGGIFASKEVDQAMQWLKAQGAMAIGQTSWGPTGFCVVDDKIVAESLKQKAEHQFYQDKNLHFIVASVRNSGGEVIVQ